jgi:hypothetical protein
LETRASVGEGIAVGSPPPLTFENCVIGIHTNSISADISLNSMDEIKQTGILCQNARASMININYNQVKSYLTGIELSNNRASTSFRITHNDIGIGTLQTSSGQTGIQVDEIPVTGKDRPHDYYIMCNTVADNFGTGMLMRTLPGFALVKNNFVNMSDFSAFPGIGMDFITCGAMTINSNSVSGADIHFGSAYHFEDNTGILVSDNISNGTQYGFEFEQPNHNTRFITNQIGDPNATPPVHDVGLYLHNNAEIGPQSSTTGGVITVFNNHWVEDISPSGSVYTSLYGAVNQSCTVQGSQASQFKVPNTSSLGEFDFPNNSCVGGGTQWFFPDAPFVKVIPNAYPNNECNVYQRPSQEATTLLDRLIAADSSSFEVFENESKFILASDLFDILSKNDSLTENDSLYGAFYTGNVNSTVGKLSKVRTAIGAVFNEDTIAINEIALLDSIVKTLHVRKSVIDTTLESGLSGSDSLVLLNEAASILNEISGNLQRQIILIAQLNNDRQEKIDSALNYNNSVSPSLDIEINEKEVNGIYLDKIINENFSLDSAQLATLQAIAIQCPFSGGRPVYTSRVILRILGDTTSYVDTTLCSGMGIRLAKNKTTNDSFILKVVPNPASEYCVFNYKLPKDKNGKIEIYNIQGKKLDEFEVKANTENHYYQTMNLIPDLYIIKLIVDDSFIGRGKMIIVK